MSLPSANTNIPVSTPRRPSTASRNMVDSPHHTTTVDQTEMKTGVAEEIGSQIWQFDASVIARMLSRRRRKPGMKAWQQGEIDTLDNYNLTIDNEHTSDAVERALQKFYTLKANFTATWPALGTTAESPFYKPVAEYLNAFVESWQTTLPDNDDRLYGKLKFVNRPQKYLKDCASGSPMPLKPDIVGLRHRKDEPDVWWSRIDEEGAQVDIPVEVKDKFSDMMNQSGTYARCLFAANGLRQFALTFAFDFKHRELIFIIFHRGGQTRSDPLPIESASDEILKKILHVFHSIMTWQSDEDAGIPSFYNGDELVLPLGPDDTEGSPFHITDTFTHKVCIRGRANQIFRVSRGAKAFHNAGDSSSEAPPQNPSDAAVPEGDVDSTGKKRKARSQLSAEGRHKRSSGDNKGKAKESSRDDAAMQVDDEEIEIDDDGSRLFISQTQFNRKAEFVKPSVYTGQGSKLSTDELVVKFSWNNDRSGNSTCVEAEFLQQCGGDFGITEHFCSFAVCTKSGDPMTNHLFLPSPNASAEEIARAYMPASSSAAARRRYPATESVTKSSSGGTASGTKKARQSASTSGSGNIASTSQSRKAAHRSKAKETASSEIETSSLPVDKPTRVSKSTLSPSQKTLKMDPESKPIVSAPEPERRTPWIHVTTFAGWALRLAKSPKQLFMGALHAMLGWLGMMHKFYLHRDISSGNVLLMLLHALRRPNFSFEYNGQGTEDDVETHYARFEFAWEEEITPERFAEQMNELRGVLAELGISVECIGALIDGDMVCKLKGTFSLEEHVGHWSGTFEFMSKNLLQAMENKRKDYLQSPIDDLFSFYYVVQWAAVYHDVPRKTVELKKLRKRIAGHHTTRSSATETIIARPKLAVDDYGPFLANCQPILREWYGSLDMLEFRWQESHKVGKGLQRDQVETFYLRSFMAFAREGVLGYATILKSGYKQLERGEADFLVTVKERAGGEHDDVADNSREAALPAPVETTDFKALSTLGSIGSSITSLGSDIGSGMDI